MNVLLFVTAFLMILSMLTYAKIDSFRYFLATRAQFETYMGTMERSHANSVAKQWYDTTLAQKTSRSQENPRDSLSSPRLSISILLDKKLRTANHSEYERSLTNVERLIHVLYGKYSFFADTLKKHPMIIHEIFEQLAEGAAALPETQKLSSISDIANIPLSGEAKKIFYLMLKGCSQVSPEPKSPLLPPPIETSAVDLSINQQDEDDLAENAIEYFSNQGYDSLFNYLTLRKTSKIRVYLAPKAVLMVFFPSEDVVENIIQERQTLYRAVINGLPASEATTKFKAQFISRSLNEDFLDFKVSKTNPSSYR